MVVEDTPPPTPPPSITPQICNHFNKGSCKFGDRCKFIHDYRNRPGLNLKNNDTVAQGRASGSNSYHQTTPSWAPQGYYNSWLAEVPSQPNAQKRQAHYRLVHQNQAYTHVRLPHVAQQPPPQLYYALPSPQPGQGLLGPASAHNSQQLGVDFDETFSLVVKPATIRMVLSLDPPGFVDSRYPHHVCLLQRSLYGLKQAPRAWFQQFTDDIILTASSPVLLQDIIGSLHNEFDMTDLEELNYFLDFPFMHDSREPYFVALERMGTVDFGLKFAEAKYRSVANVVTEIAWLRNLLRELHSPLSTVTL
nr:ribonuclease H-like domain-containing protein [Tanacetum cinerariifolium]